MADKKGDIEPIYKALMRARVLGALEAARAARAISHSGVKGRVLEILISELFRPLFPKDVEVASGQLVDKHGTLSKQQDIVVFDGSILPAVKFDTSAAIIPIEAVRCVVEVKMSLTNASLKSAHNSARELGGLKPMVRSPFGGLRACVFALSSPARAGPLSEPLRYKTIYGDVPPPLASICVAGKGCWSQTMGGWVLIGGGLPGDDVLAFMGGILNTLSADGEPKLGQYLIPLRSGALTYLPISQNVLRILCNNCPDEVIWPVAQTDLTIVVPVPSVIERCRCGGSFVLEIGTYRLRDQFYEKDVD